MLKACSWCKEALPVSLFGPHKASKDGLNYQCKPCRATYEDNRRREMGVPQKRRRDLSLAALGEKECFVCNTALPVSHFSPSQRGVGGVSYACRKCTTASLRSERAKSDKHATYIRKWRSGNLRWAAQHRQHQQRRRYASMEAVDVEAWVALYDVETCAYCKKTISLENRTVDHVKPLATGGLHNLENLVMACGPCNFRKGSLSVEAFLERINNE